MRFGGHIAATAWLVFFAGTAAAQTPDPAAAQKNSSAQQGTQSQVNNPQAEAEAAEQKANPTQPKEKKPDTANDEFERRIRLYDPLAKDEDKKDQDNKDGKKKDNGKDASKSGSARSGAASSGNADAGAAAGPEGAPLPGPAVGPDAESEAGVYSGPAVLSRPYSLLRPVIPTEERWRFYLGVNALYDSGFNGLVVSNGQTAVSSTGSEGVGLLWGLTGRRYIHRDVIGVSYRGDYSHYWPGTSYGGTNQSLAIDYSHAFSPHVILTLVEAGSIYSQNYAIENPVSVAQGSLGTVQLSTTPNVEIFDNGLKQFTTGADVTYQRTARLSFDGGVSWFGVKRNAAYLVGSTGEQGRIDGAYRINRRHTLGLAYTYNQYSFSHGFGRSQFADYTAIYSWALSRSTQIRARGGAARVDSRGLATVALPTNLADVLGQNSALVRYHTISWVSEFSMQLLKEFRRGRAANVSYSRGVSPGNGLFLTSIQQTLAAGGSMTLYRRYYGSFGAGYDSLSAAATTVNAYKTAFAFAGFSRELRPGLQANLRFDYRHYLISNAPLLHNEFRVSVGFSWSPGESLFRLW